MAGKFDRYWEMTVGGPYDKTHEKQQVFKCKDCGAETHSPDGWNGRPNPGHCHASCPSRRSDWKPGSVSDLYKRNYLKTFPNAPDIGI